MKIVGFGFRRIRAVVLTALLLAIAVLFISTSSVSAIKNGYDDPDERRAFLNALGYEIEENFETKTVKIPEVFSEVYTNYNALQKSQGYDLSLFKGERAVQYTYKVTNYPHDNEVFIHLLVIEGVIIGADVMSAEINGFMKPIK